MELKTKIVHLGSGEFEKEVLQSELPTVVDFYADWCGPCQVVSPIIDSLSIEYPGRVKFAKVDTDANPDLAEKFGVMSIPTVFIFKNGQIIERIVGAAPAAIYRKKIDTALMRPSASATQANQFKCSACGVQFNSQAELMEHAKRAHPM
jgi:thioredoxin 1